MKMRRDGKLVWHAIDEIVPAAWNARVSHDIKGIAESIRISGFRDPIEVITEIGGMPQDVPLTIVSGEGRYKAARHLNLTEIPVLEYSFDSLASAKRYSLAANREAEKSVFDPEATLTLLRELPDLEGTGFLPDELDRLERSLALPDGGEFPIVDLDTDAGNEEGDRAVVCPKCGYEFDA